MFHDFIADLKQEGHEIIITSRPLSNTIQLLDQHKMEHTVIGKHYGKSIIMKLLGYPIRVLQLFHFLSDKHIDVAVSQSSFHSPVVAWLLSIPSIYTNDNEHAKGNIISFVFASKIFLPKSILLPNYQNWLIKHKVIYYDGIKEGIYLWRKSHLIKQEECISKSPKEIFIRPEPQTAQYYNIKSEVLDNIIIQLQDKYLITILPRSTDQFKHFISSKFSNIIVLEKAIPFEDVISRSDLFIGAGGSMTREFALLGLPTISVYQSNLLSVDQVLIENGLMHYQPNLSCEFVDHIIINRHATFSKELLQNGKSSYDSLKSIVTSFGSISS